MGVVVAVSALGAGACGPALPDDALGSHSSAIVGGTADNTDDAVMALVHQESTALDACSGTVIAKVGASGILLTAAHCVAAGDAMGNVTMPVQLGDPKTIFVLPGPDWAVNLGAGLYYEVAQVVMHPQYDGNVNSPFDVALVRFLGATAAMSVIPALSPAEDNLTMGSSFTLVGFGETETGTANKMNSQRMEVTRVVQTIAAQQFLYSQTDDKGACEGDSGGPALLQTANGLRVAGVTSFGDPACTMSGVSVRVSPFASFIQSFIDGAPKALDCDECTAAAVGPGNQCTSQGMVCGSMNSSCGQFVTCASGCQTDACVTQCQGSFPSGAAAYDAVITCQCGGTCASACAGNAMCPPPPASSCGDVSDPRPACQSCIQNTCCAEASACNSDVVCRACLANAALDCSMNTLFAKYAACLGTCAGCKGTATSDGGPTAATDAGISSGAQTSHTTKDSGCACSTSAATTAPRSMALGSALLFAMAIRRGRRCRPPRVRNDRR